MGPLPLSESPLLSSVGPLGGVLLHSKGRGLQTKGADAGGIGAAIVKGSVKFTVCERAPGQSLWVAGDAVTIIRGCTVISILAVPALQPCAVSVTTPVLSESLPSIFSLTNKNLGAVRSGIDLPSVFVNFFGIRVAVQIIGASRIIAAGESEFGKVGSVASVKCVIIVINLYQRIGQRIGGCNAYHGGSGKQNGEGYIHCVRAAPPFIHRIGIRILINSIFNSYVS